MAATYTITILLSAMLLFLVEPMFAKMVLPQLGGSPAVWNTAVVFYQSALLLGYIYAHGTTSWLGARRHSILHLGILLLPLLVLPIAIPAGWTPPVETNPVPWMLVLMLVTVGLPFAVLSTSSPVLQLWFSRTNHPAGRDPYFLYAASNVGSLLGLLAYPFVVEQYLGLREQRLIWAGGYIVFAILVLTCAIFLWRSPRPEPAGATPAAATPQAAGVTPISGQLTLGRRLRWVVLAFVPSSLMLSVTTYLTTTIAPFPLLWVIPLAIYLLTFVFVFSRRNPFGRTPMIRLLPIILIPLLLTLMLPIDWPVAVLIPLHLIAFFVIAMVCHRAIADDRPSSKDLTEFYLWMSVGGALGGVFVSLLAPVLFSSVLEYPLVLVLACLVAPATASTSETPRSRRLDIVLPAALGLIMAALALLMRWAAVQSTLVMMAAVFGLPAVICYSFSRRPLRFGLGIAVMLIIASVYTRDLQQAKLYQERTFFGINTVNLNTEINAHVLRHGEIAHGIQSLDPDRRCEPLSYYASSGPIGQAFAMFKQEKPRRSIAVIGLGTGTLAAYHQPGQEWTFYEIDPSVVRIARDPRFFTFLSDCAPDSTIVLGDGRLSLRNAGGASFDLIVLDAYSGDSLPLHLLTREALQLYQEKLAPGGILAFHISNRYFDLKPALGGLSQDAGLVAFSQRDVDVSPQERASGKLSSEWVLMARNASDLGQLTDDPRWKALDGNSSRLWTDDFSSILWALRGQ